MKNKTNLIFGVGVNDADYEVYRYEIIDGKRKIVWRCTYYLRWNNMLTRCYSKKLQDRLPTYKGCIVCEEWKYFSNFKKWMENQNWEGRCLDKDLLIEENKIYGPTTCVFLPHKLNTFIVTRGNDRGLYPLGVSYKKKTKSMINERSKPYVCLIKNRTGKNVYLGKYSTPEKAHQVYLNAKLKYCKDYLVEFKDEPVVIKGLTRIHSKIQFHIENNLELTSF